MFKQVKTRKKFVALTGQEYIPVATLIDSDDDRTCHVARYEDCYVCFLDVDDSGFVPTVYLFPELCKVLATLPALDEYNEETE